MDTKTTPTQVKQAAPFTPPLAPEFVTILNEVALDTLLGYLQAHNAPSEVTRLTEYVVVMAGYGAWARSPDHALRPDARCAYEIEATIVKSINLIAALGGVFYGSASMNYPRQPVPWGKLKQAERGRGQNHPRRSVKKKTGTTRSRKGA